MKNNYQIWSVKQKKIYYKVVGLYGKLCNIEDFNGYEKQILNDVSKIQSMFDLLKLESDLLDVKNFNQDSQLLKTYLSSMADGLESRTGCLQNKKFTFLVLDYFLTLKPLIK